MFCLEWQIRYECKAGIMGEKAKAGIYRKLVKMLACCKAPGFSLLNTKTGMMWRSQWQARCEKTMAELMCGASTYPDGSLSNSELL